ncbi:MAG: hypothetical protein ABEJ05_07320 [Haloglomus sp.]
MEADALATTVALPLTEARELAAGWDRLEALVVHGGVFRATEGFNNHVVNP